MSDGHLDDEMAAQLHDYVNGLASTSSIIKRYIALLTNSSKADITEESHFLMVSALYVWQYREKFWLAYWSKLHTMLTRLLTNNLERAVRLFSFWFALLPNKTAQLERYYVVQQFFLGLRQHMIGGRILDDYSKALKTYLAKPQRVHGTP